LPITLGVLRLGFCILRLHQDEDKLRESGILARSPAGANCERLARVSDRF